MNGIEVRGARILFAFGPIAITETILSLTIVTVVLSVLGFVLGHNLSKYPGKIQVLTEKGVLILTNLVKDTMGEHNVGWTPYIGTIFLMSLTGSLISMTGFLRSTTADLGVVLTWSVMTSVIIWYRVIKRNGFWGWIRGFSKPLAIMTPMNIVSEIAQPIAMAFRHFGNIAGGSIITTILYTALALASAVLIKMLSGKIVISVLFLSFGLLFFVIGIVKQKRIFMAMGYLTGVLGGMGILNYLDVLKGVYVPILQVGIPAILSVYFDLFSGFVQAFVFSLLSMVYIANACPPPD